MSVNRTDRLYALVEELRAVAPRPRSARWLAGKFEVSVRTVERDLDALQQSGVPIYAEAGRTGGYCLDKTHTLPPVNLTPEEAVAMAVALQRLEGTPFQASAGAALRKLVAAMQKDAAAAAHDLAGRIHLIAAADPQPPPTTTRPPSPVRPSPQPPRHTPATPPYPTPAMPHRVADALTTGRVLRIGYDDRDGTATVRDIEPLGYVGKESHWFLVAWCRLRDGLRVFRTDRITSVAVTAEVPVPRPLRREDLDIPYGIVQPLTLS